MIHCVKSQEIKDLDIEKQQEVVVYSMTARAAEMLTIPEKWH
jgi:hypothetical protein